MLVFKSNIYETRDASRVTTPPSSEGAWFDPARFVRNTLEDEFQFFGMVEANPDQFMRDDLAGFYPHAHRFGGFRLLRDMIRILSKGLEDKDTWYLMNTYHFCVLYDAMQRHAYNYNHDSNEEMLNLYPELKGKPVNFALIVRDYFFNTVFLLDEDKYNGMGAPEKQRLGFNDACQFGVINGLVPTPEEMELESASTLPYQVEV